MDQSSTTVIEGGTAAPGRRRPAIDIARGVAVLAMIVFHTAWDLTTLNLVETDITEVASWRWFARTIAGSFLVLVGTGVVMAHGRQIRIRPFLRRVALLALAALLITAVTFFVFPTSYIFFGILHNIAVSSLIALAFVRAPSVVTAIAALAFLYAPFLVSAPALDAPLLAFLGFGSTAPITNDFVPIFPWAGFVLAGVAAARLLRLNRAPPAAGGDPLPKAAGALAWVGRHSLAIYLLHQPLIFGLLWALVQVIGVNPVAEAAPFMNRCTSSCTQSRVSQSVCEASCTCTVDGFKQAGLWRVLLSGRQSATELSRASEIAQSCLEKNR